MAWNVLRRAYVIGDKRTPPQFAMDLQGAAQTLWPSVAFEVRQAGEALEDSVLENLSGGVVGVRSGRLLNSVRTTTTTSSDMARSVLTMLPRYLTHEHGALIKPRFAKMLRIPFPGGPASHIDPFGGLQLRTIPKKFHIQRSKRGNLILIETETGRPWYMLKSQVRIPKRPIVEPARRLVAQQLGTNLSILMRLGR